jgi:hypothetical protein
LFFWINYEFELDRYVYEFTIVYSNCYAHIYSIRQKLRLSLNDLSVLISNFIIMKKRNLKSLNLNKESISSFKEQEAVKGGSFWDRATVSCPFTTIGQTITTCITVR